MAGGDNDGAGGFLCQDSIADNGRGRWLQSEVNFNTIAGKDSGGGSGKFI